MYQFLSAYVAMGLLAIIPFVACFRYYYKTPEATGAIYIESKKLVILALIWPLTTLLLIALLISPKEAVLKYMNKARDEDKS